MAKHSILIVEDEALIMLQITEILTSAVRRDRCSHAGRRSPREDRNVIPARSDPHGHRTDGELDGIETAMAIREKSEVPIIFITAYENEKTMSDIQNISCSCYIPKPFEDESILEAVRKFEPE
jgi:CheY-like chemotaxis protein